MFKSFSIPLTWSELARRTYKETMADNCLGLAAQLAYYILLALVPTLVFMLALISFFPSELVQQLIASINSFAPGDVGRILEEQITQISSTGGGGLLTFGILMALWSSSSAMVAITDSLNRAYDIEEGRPWWRVRLTAIALTLGLGVFVIAAFALVLAGPTVGEAIASRVGLGDTFVTVWAVARWPNAFVLVVVAVAIINYVAPDADQDWEWITPGAVLATVLWLVASLAFKIYVSRFADYNATYGSLGGVIVLMLWLYMSALAVLVGAEMNAEIEHASPHGKNPGEKVAGEKKKIGARAARAFEERRHAPSRSGARRPARPAAAAQPATVWYVPAIAITFTRWLMKRPTS